MSYVLIYHCTDVACRYIEDYGPLVWTKATWEAYPPEIEEEANKRYEELRKEFVGR